MEMAVEPDNSDNSATAATMLAMIRKRRWFLWGLILIYIPASVVLLQFTVSNKTLGILFLVWLLLLCIAVVLMAVSKCPRCGNYFHVRDSTLSFFPKCSHCGLHIRKMKEGGGV